MKDEYLEKIYAGWLAKIIGIRLGAHVEGWTYREIKEKYGALDHYPVDYTNFAADDDSNGPLFFLRAVEDSGRGKDFTSQDVGDALLNYAAYEHGFFWWGGYGISTEHTAYLNLRAGIPAPRSGSVEHNGAAVAEQIGGQIFIDSWGLVNPGNPDRAAEHARRAAGATHGGNGVYGGIFVAVCISHAFDEHDIRKIIEKGLSYIPADSEYTRVVRAVMAYYDEHPGDWEQCYDYIFNNFGYDRYPGMCHIIPNTAVMILSLLYGEGDFDDTLNICNRCGWDTDCNVGNIATIMGVRNGLEAISYSKWREPVNDLCICATTLGSLNILDIPYGAAYMAKWAWSMAGEPVPAGWEHILGDGIESCHFEFPGSTHAMRARGEGLACRLENSGDAAYTGTRSLKLSVEQGGGEVFLYKQTYYRPEDFSDSRYDPEFSPLAYPGQVVHGSAFLPEGAAPCAVRLYARDIRSGEVLAGDRVELVPGQWAELAYHIPARDGALLGETGFLFEGLEAFTAYVDDLHWGGRPDYSIDFSREEMELWHNKRRSTSQFARMKGLLYLEDNALHLSCADEGEAYTGHHGWSDYHASFRMTPLTGAHHLVNVRVQGAMRSYAVGFAEEGRLCLYKNTNGYTLLDQVPFDWRHGATYNLEVEAQGAFLGIKVDGKPYLTYTDANDPFLTGCVGVSVRKGSHCRWESIAVN